MKKLFYNWKTIFFKSSKVENKIKKKYIKMFNMNNLKHIWRFLIKLNYGNNN